MNKLMQELAAIKPRGTGNFAYEINSSLLSDSNNQFYSSNLLDALKVISDKEQGILSSSKYDSDDDLCGFYLINDKEFLIDDLSSLMRNIKTSKKILEDNFGSGYQVIA